MVMWVMTFRDIWFYSEPLLLQDRKQSNKRAKLGLYHKYINQNLWLMLTSNNFCKVCIESIVTSAVKKVGSMCRVKQSLFPESVL